MATLPAVISEPHQRQRHWSVKYLGKPWRRRDEPVSSEAYTCWSLVKEVYRGELGIWLPDYEEDGVCRLEAIYLEAMQRGYDPSIWMEVKSGEERELDIVVFRIRGVDSHIGVVTSAGYMLHASEGNLSCVERYNVDPWTTVGYKFYRAVPEGAAKLIVARPSNSVAVVRSLSGGIEFLEPMEGEEGNCSIAWMIAELFPNPSDVVLMSLRVTIGSHVIPREHWARVYPNKWDEVVIRVVPQGSGLFKIILSLALTVGAAAISAGVLGPAGLAIAGSWLAAGSWSATALAATVAIGGNILLNALIPTKVGKPTGDMPEVQTYTIGGYQNQLNADGPVPTVLGQIRFAPPYAAMPYSENVGFDRYHTALFLVGYGPVEIEDIYIGNTPISYFRGVTVEIREGYPSDAPITLYPRQVIEDAENQIEMQNSIGFTTRVTAKNVVAAELEFFFPRGLIGYQTNSNNQTYPVLIAVNLNVQYRLLGSPTWTSADTTFSAMWANPLYFVHKLTFPTRGQYEIRVWRNSPEWDDQIGYIYSGAAYVSKFSWTATRSFRPEAPLNYSNPMALIAVKILASSQLNGQLQALNVMCRRVCKDWDPDTNTWISRVTSNPASLYRYVHQGPENAFPRSDDMLDLLDIESWAEYCIDNDLKYDAVHQSNESQDSVLDAVAAAGRALKHDRGDKYSIIVDRPRTTFNAFITPANSRDFRISNPKNTMPHGFEIKFLDATNKFQPASRIVPWPDHTGAITKLQQIELPGKTDPDEIWIEARRKMHEAMLRQNSYTVVQDLDALTAVRGDAALVTHYVMRKTQVGGYIVAVLGGGTHIRVDHHVTMHAGDIYQCRIRRPDGTTDVRALETFEGTTNILRFLDDGEIPSPGDLVMIGEAMLAETEVIIKDIEYGEDYSATLTMVAHAPTLDALAAAETPPTWDGIIGGDGGAGSIAPNPPSIGVIASGLEVGPVPPVYVFVPVIGAVDGGRVAGYEVDHRLVGGGAWTTVTITISDGGAQFTGYNKGDNIEVRARAFGPGVSPLYSGYSSIVTHEVAANDAATLQVSSFTVTRNATALNWTYDFALNLYPAGAGVRIKYRNGTWSNYSDFNSGTTLAGKFTASPFDSSAPFIIGTGTMSFACIALNPDNTESGTAVIIQVAY
jgi:hypothetical protein